MKLTETQLRNIVRNTLYEMMDNGGRSLEFEETMTLAHALLMVRNDFYIFRPEDLSRPVNTAGNTEMKGDIVRDLLCGYGTVVKEDDETLYVLLTDLGNRQKYVIEGNKELMNRFSELI